MIVQHSLCTFGLYFTLKEDFKAEYSESSITWHSCQNGENSNCVEHNLLDLFCCIHQFGNNCFVKKDWAEILAFLHQFWIKLFSNIYNWDDRSTRKMNKGIQMKFNSDKCKVMHWGKLNLGMHTQWNDRALGMVFNRETG